MRKILVILIFALLFGCNASNGGPNQEVNRNDDSSVVTTTTSTATTAVVNTTVITSTTASTSTLIKDENGNEILGPDSYTCGNLDTEKICEVGEGPEIRLLHYNNYNRIDKMFYIPKRFTSEEEYINYIISTNSFIAIDPQDGEVEIMYIYIEELDNYGILAADSDNNQTEWLIPIQVKENIDKSSSNTQKPGSDNTDNTDNSDNSGNNDNSDNNNSNSNNSSDSKLPTTVEEGSIKYTSDIYTKNFKSVTGLPIKPVTVYEKEVEISDEKFFNTKHQHAYGLMTKGKIGTVYINKPKDFSYNIDALPKEDIASEMKTNVTYENGILKYRETYNEDNYSDFIYDYNTKIMEAYHYGYKDNKLYDVTYCNYDGVTRMTRCFSATNGIVSAEGTIINHATQTYYKFTDDCSSDGGNSMTWMPNNIIENKYGYDETSSFIIME